MKDRLIAVLWATVIFVAFAILGSYLFDIANAWECWITECPGEEFKGP